MTKTLTTAELFASLNVLRAAAGKTTLASWKKSRVALEAAVAELTPVAPVVKTKKTKTETAPKAARLFAKGVFKSKVPAMKNERGKVWVAFEVALTNGEVLPAKKEQNGTYFYFFRDDVCYSGKYSDFNSVPAEKVGVLNLAR